MAYQYSTEENTQNNVVSDVISNYQPSLFPKAETDDKGKLRVLSLFSGCGGMDIGNYK